jgi:hypothetical protein
MCVLIDAYVSRIIFIQWIDDSIASLRRQIKSSKIIASVNKPSCRCNLPCNIAIDIVKVKAMSIIALTLDE